MSSQHDVNVVVSSHFLSSLTKTPSEVQPEIKSFVAEFKQTQFMTQDNTFIVKENESSETLRLAISDLHSVVILKPRQANLLFIMWVGTHEEAEKWAINHEASIHPETGGLQVLDVSLATQEESIMIEEESKSDNAFFLFADYSIKQISSLGVPNIYLDKVMTIRSKMELLTIKHFLPPEVFEVLHLLANGSDYQTLLASYNDAHSENVDTHDFEKALQRKSTQRMFKLVTDDDDLKQMLYAPLEQWRVFLHPTQRQYVELEAKGPTRVLGGAGTGKTVIAMHRAVYLAKKLIEKGAYDKRILLITFTEILANDIRHNLTKIASAPVIAQIEVKNIDAWVREFLEKNAYNTRLVYENDEQRQLCWNKVGDYIHSDLDLPQSFYKEEWRHIILQHGIKSKDAYFAINRNGRGTALDRMERAKIWPVFNTFRCLMKDHNICDMHDAFHEILAIIEASECKFPYASIIVDEAQDMGNAAFTLLRKLVPEQENDLFIIGDGHQRIYRNKVVLGRCGINIKGRRSKKLTVNYRTTDEIKQFASRIMGNALVENLDGDVDSVKDSFSLMNGNEPRVDNFLSFEDEISHIVNSINQLLNNHIDAKDICLVLKNRTLRDKYANALISAGLEIFILDNNNLDSDANAVRVSTIYRVKGLEFGFVFLAGVNQEHFALKENLTKDPVEKRDREFNQRALLHVAATRAIRELNVSCYGKLSDLIK